MHRIVRLQLRRAWCAFVTILQLRRPSRKNFVEKLRRPSRKYRIVRLQLGRLSRKYFVENNIESNILGELG